MVRYRRVPRISSVCRGRGHLPGLFVLNSVGPADGPVDAWLDVAGKKSAETPIAFRTSRAYEPVLQRVVLLQSPAQTR